MASRLRQHSYMELFLVGLLSVLACWQAWHFSAAGLLTLFHSLFLITGYLCARLLLARLNPWAGKLFFAACILLLSTDLIASYLSGMHLNFFLLSLMFQPGFAEAIGLRPISISLLVFTSVAAAMLLAKYFSRPAFFLRARIIASSALLAFFLSQGVFVWHFYKGNAEIEEIRRELPFFSSVHPYRIRTLFGLLADTPQAESPFGLWNSNSKKSSPPPTTSSPAHRKNILLIIADSLRAKDIEEDKRIMPNLRLLADQGTMSLSHISNANCTHFSFYSMFTGKLPTDFGQDRRRHRAIGLLASLQQAGYQLSTAEATTLDWYETSKIIFPSATERYIAHGGTQTKRDEEVTSQTLSRLNQRAGNSTPFFHLAYYYGPHYPYDPALTSGNAGAVPSSKSQYKAALRALDGEIGKLTSYLEANHMLDNTIVILTSDHGEEFMQEDGVTGHGSRLSKAQIQVPFIVINKTGAHLPSQIQSHQDIKGMLLGNRTQETAIDKPVVVAQCGYDYPRGFLLKYPDHTVEFDVSAGYLSPVMKGDASNSETTARTGKAAFDLIKATTDNQ